MSTYSPFSEANVINYGDGEFSLEGNFPNLISLAPKTHTIREGETLASISYQYYGDSGYWGKIANYNNIINPFKEVIPGKQIMIP